MEDTKQPLYRKVLEDEPKQDRPDLPVTPGLEVWEEVDEEVLRADQEKHHAKANRNIQDAYYEGNLAGLFEENYTDGGDIAPEEATMLIDSFTSDILTVQVNSQGEVYLNPDGLIYTSDLINLLGHGASDEYKVDSEDGVVKQSEYFSKGYNYAIEKGILPFSLTRKILYQPVTAEVFDLLLSKELTPENSEGIQELSGFLTHIGVWESKQAQSYINRLDFSKVKPALDQYNQARDRTYRNKN